MPFGLRDPAEAADFDLPGLDVESSAFVAGLAKAFPTGGTADSRSQAEARAAAAAARNNWTAAATALESRLGQSEPTAQLWLQLSQAELKRIPSDPRRALDAAWQSYQLGDDTDAKAAAMVAGAQALLAQNRPAQAGQAFAQAVALAPDNAGYKQMLADANQAAGAAGRPGADGGGCRPRRAPASCSTCRPPAATTSIRRIGCGWTRRCRDAAVTRESDEICISGLPLAATTPRHPAAGHARRRRFGDEGRRGWRRSPWATARRCWPSTTACSCCRTARRRAWC